MAERTIEIDGQSDFGPCDCCGNNSRTVWGYVAHRGKLEAMYFVQWTLGSIDQHGANFDLIVGNMTKTAPHRERRGIALAFRRMPSGPAFMVIDAASRPLARHEEVGVCLRREEVIGTSLAKQAFDIVDAIWLQDDRIREITHG